MEASHELTPPRCARAIVRRACEELRDHFGDDERAEMYNIRVRDLAVRLPGERSLDPNRVAVIIRKRVDPDERPNRRRKQQGDPDPYSHVFIAAGLCNPETYDLQVLSNSLEPARGYGEFDAWVNRLITLIEAQLARDSNMQ